MQIVGIGKVRLHADHGFRHEDMERTLIDQDAIGQPGLHRPKQLGRRQFGIVEQPLPRRLDGLLGLLRKCELGEHTKESLVAVCPLAVELLHFGHGFAGEQVDLRQAVHLRVAAQHGAGYRRERAHRCKNEERGHQVLCPHHSSSPPPWPAPALPVGATNSPYGVGCSSRMP